jgi:hypothetical protein
MLNDLSEQIAGETLITLKAVTALFPSPRAKRLHIATVRRWWLRGIAGVRLGTVMIGGTRYTSREELARFRRAATTARERRPERLNIGPSAKVAQREHEQAKAANDKWLGRGKGAAS